MSANFSQTNRNANRYFFATSENGEQTLGLQYGTTGGAAPISTMAVSISGTGGNAVIVSEAPCYLATEFMLAEDALMGGTNSTYNTLSSINTNLTGFNISMDRVPGSGITTIENYKTNAAGGFEFLSRGISSVVQSTIYTGLNNFLSTIGNPGAIGVLQANGSLLTGSATAGAFTSLEVGSGVSPFGAGRSCYGIRDLSGANGTTSIARWSLATQNLATGNNTGSDFEIWSFDDAGGYNGTAMSARRADNAVEMNNISSFKNFISTNTYAQVFPATKDNVEFGNGNANSITTISYGTPQVLFSTPVSGLNPNTETLLNINFINTLSTGNNFISYKVGFSTATAYTNLLQTAYVPGGSWGPSAPGVNTPIGATNICGMFDSDGINPDGTAMLYVAGALTNPTATDDQIQIKKGVVSEATRNALVYRPV